MNKWMAMAVLCSMSVFAVCVPAAPRGTAKAAKVIFDKINPAAKAVATKRGIDYIRHYDSGDSLDRMRLYQERYGNHGAPDYIPGSQSDLFIRNPCASQDDRKPVASQNGTDSLSVGRQVKFVNPYQIDPIITRSSMLYSGKYEEPNRRRVEHNFNLDGTDASRNRIQEIPQVFKEEPVPDVDQGYSVMFSPEL